MARSAENKSPLTPHKLSLGFSCSNYTNAMLIERFHSPTFIFIAMKMQRKIVGLKKAINILHLIAFQNVTSGVMGKELKIQSNDKEGGKLQ